MRFLRSLLILSLAAAALSACSDIRESLGMGRSAPDEFAVVDRPPLAMPPDFGLRPPAPGAPRPQEIDPSQRASETLFGAEPVVNQSVALSPSEKALLLQTGADKASPNIRATINNESTQVVDVSPHLVDQLLWWKKAPLPGTTVDSAAEAERIKQAQDKGQPLNQGATPIIEQNKSGWLGL